MLAPRALGIKYQVLFFLPVFLFTFAFLNIAEWKHRHDSLWVWLTCLQQWYQHTIVHSSTLGALLPSVDHKFDFSHQPVSRKQPRSRGRRVVCRGTSLRRDSVFDLFGFALIVTAGDDLSDTRKCERHRCCVVRALLLLPTSLCQFLFFS